MTVGLALLMNPGGLPGAARPERCCARFSFETRRGRPWTGEGLRLPSQLAGSCYLLSSSVHDVCGQTSEPLVRCGDRWRFSCGRSIHAGG